MVLQRFLTGGNGTAETSQEVLWRIWGSQSNVWTSFINFGSNMTSAQVTTSGKAFAASAVLWSDFWEHVKRVVIKAETKHCNEGLCSRKCKLRSQNVDGDVGFKPLLLTPHLPGQLCYKVGVLDATRTKVDPPVSWWKLFLGATSQISLGIPHWTPISTALQPASAKNAHPYPTQRLVRTTAAKRLKLQSWRKGPSCSSKDPSLEFFTSGTFSHKAEHKSHSTWITSIG